MQEEKSFYTPQELWEAERLKGIGGSDWGDVLSLEPYGCALRLWYEKREEPPDFPTNKPGYFERGHKMEPLVVEGAEERLGVKLRKVGKLARQNLPEWWIGNPDRMVIADDVKPTGVFEAKTKGPWPFKKLKHEGVPEREVLQMRHYMALTGWSWALYAALEPVTWDWYFSQVEHSETVTLNMRVAGDRFWRMVENGPSPERLMPDDKRCQSCAWRLTCHGGAFNPSFEKADGEREELDSMELRMMLEEYDRVNEVYSDAGKLREEAKDRLRNFLGDNPRKVSIDGRGLVTYQTIQNRLDTKALKRDFPEIATKYTKSTVGKLTLKVY